MDWFHNMIPSLFPFMILQSVFIGLNYEKSLGKILKVFLKPFFKLSEQALCAIPVGFLCGFPMGASITRDLYLSNKITKKEAEILLAFTNNLGPIYCFTTILPIFPKEKHLIILLLMYGIPFLYGILLSHISKIEKSVPATSEEKNTQKLEKVFPQAINNAIHAIVCLGGCMIFFNVFRILPMLLPVKNVLYNCISAGLIEISSFIHVLNQNSVYFTPEALLLMLSLVHPGGLSCIMQTMCILSETDLSIHKYVFHQMMQTFIWFIMSLIICFF